MLIHVQPGVHHNPQVLYIKGVFQKICSQNVLLHDEHVVPPPVPGFILPLIELHKVPVSTSVHGVEVPLDGSMTLWCIRTPPSFESSANLLRCTLCPLILIINEDIEHNWTQDSPTLVA